MDLLTTQLQTRRGMTNFASDKYGLTGKQINSSLFSHEIMRQHNSVKVILHAELLKLN